MIVEEPAFSVDGYIIDQSYIDNIEYGNNTSDSNGCGWIACYNLCKYLGIDKSTEEIVTFMEKYLWGKGFFGTAVNGVRKFMQSLGIETKTVVGKKAILKTDPEFGVVFYFYGQGFHYTFFYKYDKVNYRFLNDSFEEFDIRPLSRMLKKEVRLGLCMAFVV